MARSIHVRLDDAGESHLAVLKAQGLNDSDAVRAALREAAARRASRSALRAEAAALAANQEDAAEMLAIREELDELAPPEID
jgi:Arc/MetJ-type ribon-helix-helix transcriptional regulator